MASHTTKMLAHAAYEVVRAWKFEHGDKDIVPWADADSATKDYTMSRVDRILSDPRAGDATFHNEWMAQMKRDGWDHGKLFDEKKKSDPLMVSFHLLPPMHQAKERSFRAVVLSLSRVQPVAQHNVFAYSRPGFNPAFISLNEVDGIVTVEVRQEIEPLSEQKRADLLAALATTGDLQQQAYIALSLKEVVKLSARLSQYVYETVNSLSHAEKTALAESVRRELDA